MKNTIKVSKKLLSRIDYLESINSMLSDNIKVSVTNPDPDFITDVDCRKVLEFMGKPFHRTKGKESEKKNFRVFLSSGEWTIVVSISHHNGKCDIDTM